MKLAVVIAALAVLPAAALAQDKPAARAPAKGAKDVVATVNGVPVPGSRMEFMLQQQRQHGAPDNDQTRALIREELVNREVVQQEAQRTGIAKSPDVQTQLELARQEILVGAYLRDWVRKHPVTDAEVQKEYDRAKAQNGDKEYHARHILVDTEDEAKALIAELKKGAKFEDLASKNSKDTGSKERGGDLDWNVPTAFDKQFSDAMVKLDKGKVSDTPVHTRFGWHVIKVEDVREAQFPALAQVKPRLQQQITQHKVDQLVKDLRAKAKVQ